MKRVSRILVALTLVLSAKQYVKADVLLFDNSAHYDFDSGRGAGDSPLAVISVSAPVTIEAISVFNQMSTPGNIKFVIFNNATSASLYISPAKAFAADAGGDTFKKSDPFSFTLLPGTTYDIGGISDVAGNWGTNNQGLGTTQNGITHLSHVNGNVSNFSNPTLGGQGGAEIIIQLFGPSAPVPEPTSLALFGLTTFAGAIYCGWRRRKQLAQA